MDASSDTGQNEAPRVAVLGYYNKRACVLRGIQEAATTSAQHGTHYITGGGHSNT